MTTEREQIVVSLLNKPLQTALSELNEEDPSVVMSYLSGGELMVNYPWVEAKPMLIEKHGEKVVETFLQEFDNESSKKARRKCCIGLKRANNLTELDLLDNIHQLQAHEKATGKIDSELAERLGVRLSYLVEHGDHKPICKLGEIVKNKNQYEPVEPGAYLSEKIWESFCLYFLNHQILPTKKELRKRCEIPDDDGNQKRVFTRELKKIGLGGLPIHTQYK